MGRGSNLKRTTYSKDDPRVAEHWNILDIKNLKPATDASSVVIVQYPDDEGVRLNNGRPGAKLGPQRILQYLGRMIFNPSETPNIFVLKSFISAKSLKARHDLAEKNAFRILNLGYRLVTLGGGHDYGYSDASAYYQSAKGRILNIDAHLDVRPVLNDRLNSGTPFFRFLERFGGQDFFAWGIQRHCNAVAHLKWATERGMQIFDERSPAPRIDGPIGLSVCLDAFQGIRGVSAPALVGLSTSKGLETIKYLSPQSQWLGLYETAPKYDPLNEDSARFAALLAYHFIHSRKNSG